MLKTFTLEYVPILFFLPSSCARNIKDNILKPCFVLLFQGQVTRAQEAEENYVIKRELAVVRQQCTTASESLERAQDTIRELQQHTVGHVFVLILVG